MLHKHFSEDQRSDVATQIKERYVDPPVTRTNGMFLLSWTEDAMRFAETEVKILAASWLESQWDELDWDRIKELQTRDLIEHRRLEAAEAQRGQCFDCPKFVKHVGTTS